jgi:hypothetical protein
MLGGFLAALVLLALSVGVASPATAAGPLPLLAGCDSSVTCQPANVMMLADSGILSVPASGGAVGTVASSTSTAAGASVGGPLDVLAAFAVGGFGLTQLFGPGGLWGGPAQLSTDGMGATKLNVTADPPGAVPTKDYSNATFTESWSNTAHTGNKTWITTNYAVTGGDPHQRYCVASVSDLSGGSNNLVATYANASTYSIGWGSSAGASCPTVSGAQSYTSFRANNTGVAASPVVSFKGVSTYPGANVPAPIVTQNATDGVLKMHAWCAGADGVLVDYMTAQIASLKSGQSVNLAEAKCPAGKAAAAGSIDWTPTGGSTTTLLPPKSTAPADRSPAVNANLANPACAAGGCVLQLSKINGDLCGPTGQLCPEWAKDPAYASNYQCKFGGSVVDINACSAYRDPSRGVLPNVTAGGTYLSPTAPVPTSFGVPATNPSTGTAPAPGPSFQSGTDPQGCRPSSLWEILNPFSMFTTMQCVIKDAFVPDPVKVQTSVQGVQNAWAQTPMVKVSGMVASITAALPAGSGCSGISFTFPSVLGVAAQNFTVLNACSDPVASIAATVRIIGAIGMIVSGIMALTKMAGGVIALPGLGKSGES